MPAKMLLHNFKGIFRIKEDAIPALTGLRSLMTIWVIMFHGLWHMGYHITKEDYDDMMTNHPIIANGFMAVDVFFVLTGFLLAYPVFLKGGLNLSTVAKFILKRLVRILPLLIFVVAVFCIVIFPSGLFSLSLLGEESIAELVHIGEPNATHYRIIFSN